MISFHLLFTCSTPSCEVKDDRLSISLSDGMNQELVSEYITSSFEQNKWLRQTLKFSAQEKLIKVKFKNFNEFKKLFF